MLSDLSLFLISARARMLLILITCLTMFGSAKAQYTILHTFNGANIAGVNPVSSLTLVGTNLYGVNQFEGNANNLGELFKIDTNGSNFTVLHVFAGGSDGANPIGNLTLIGTTLYGMTQYGGGGNGGGPSGGSGTIFKMNTDGSAYNVIYRFSQMGNGTDPNGHPTGGGGGQWPTGCLTVNGTKIYGMTPYGGLGLAVPGGGSGVIFSLNTDGTGYAILHTFDYQNHPAGSLTLIGSVLYGINGSVFQMNTDGSGYSVLGGGGSVGSLTFDGTNLYAMYGGVWDMQLDGSGLTTLHSFGGGYAYGDVKFSGTNIFGMTSSIGTNDFGVAFMMNKDGSGYTELHSFINASGYGGYQKGSLTLIGKTLYGTTWGDTTRDGIVFALQLPDTIPPTVAITNLVNGSIVSNQTYNVMGKATDNVAVANVFLSVNNGAWTNATTGNAWTNWSAMVNLIVGTNTIQAYAVDNSGNVSATNSVNINVVLSTVLTVNTNGSGTVSPNYNGVPLQIFAQYSMTATAGIGCLFTNWTGGISSPLAVLTNSPILQFVMQSNLVLQANFVNIQKPNNSITTPTSGQHWSNNVFTVTGKASDNVAVANVFCSVNNTTWTNATTVNNWKNWAATANLIVGTNTIQAYAVDKIGRAHV